MICLGGILFGLLSAQATQAQNNFFVRTDGADAPVCNGQADSPAASAPNCAFRTIQNAVVNSAIGDTIFVAPGIYAETVVVDKSLTLKGAQAGQAVNPRFALFSGGGNGPKADPLAETIIVPPATDPIGGGNGLLHLMANNVTVDGFVLDGNNPDLDQSDAVVVGGINIDSRLGIRTEDGSGDAAAANNVVIANNIVQNFAERGIELSNANSFSPSTSGSVISGNLVRTFGHNGIVLTFNAHADITTNTINSLAYPAEAGIWIQDFRDVGGASSLTIAENSITVGQDNFGGIWVNLAYFSTIDINHNSINAAAGVSGASDFTFGIYVTSLRAGTTAGLDNNLIGATGGEFARGLAFWTLRSGSTTTTVTNGSIGNARAGISVHDNDPSFGLAGDNSAINVSGVNISGAGVGALVDAAGSMGDTVAMQITGNTSINNAQKGVNVVGLHASVNLHDNDDALHNNVVGLEVNGGAATVTGNNFYTNSTGLRFLNGGTATVHFNRIVSTTTAIDNPFNLTSNLENNWWGCNEGPGSGLCGGFTGTGADTNPRIILGTIATPDSMTPNGTATITADMTKNSDGATVMANLPSMHVALTATQGTIDPADSMTSGGQATAMFTSTGSQSGSACAEVDGQTACSPIVIDMIAPTVTYAPLPATNSTVNPTLNVSITDNHAVTGAMIFFNVDGGSFDSNPCNQVSGTAQNGTWDCVISGTLSSPSVITYYVTALDEAANPVANPDAGWSMPNLFSIGPGILRAGNFANVSLADGVALGGNVMVNGELSLNGKVVTANNRLILACDASTIGAGPASYVFGNVQKNYCAPAMFSYPVGTANGYSPVEANITAVGAAGDSLTVNAVEGYYGANGETPALVTTSLQRYWDLNKTGAITADIKFHYLAADVIGGGGDYQVVRISAGNAASFLNAADCGSNPAASPCVDVAQRTMFMAGISNFSRWTAGPPAIPTSTKATIAGRILTADGQPIANARIEITNLAGGTVTVVTGNLGMFLAEGLDVGASYVITVSASRYLFSEPSRVINLNGDTLNEDFIAAPQVGFVTPDPQSRSPESSATISNVHTAIPNFNLLARIIEPSALIRLFVAQKEAN
ncbi:MAG: carboxypeptidase-like regulatory domain-containing protein [Pyrinomonadaceae bacterium]